MKSVPLILVISSLCVALEASRSFYNRKARDQIYLPELSPPKQDKSPFGWDDTKLPTITVNPSLTTVDFSSQAVTRRLQIYIEGFDAVALYSELAANRQAASLPIFESIFPLLMAFINLPEQNESNLGRNPVNVVASIFNAFIHFGVDVTRANHFKDFDTLTLFVNKFKSLPKPILSFFVLIQDCHSIQSFSNPNFYSVNRAIMMLPNLDSMIRIVDLLYSTFGSRKLDEHKIPLRIFRDSHEEKLCERLWALGFDSSKHGPLYTKCRLALNHPKWEFFGEIYGKDVIENFLDSSHYTIPQKVESKSDRPSLPFIVYPVAESNSQRRDLYAKAYGVDSISKFD